MAIDRISLQRYLEVLGDRHLIQADIGHAWFASEDCCILGHVSLCPSSNVWDAAVLVATSTGWAETEVEPGEFATLRSAESALVNCMADLVVDGVDCRNSQEMQRAHDVVHY